MKKIIALLAIVALIATTGIIAVGKKLPSVGYVLVGPKTMVAGQCDIIKDFNP